MAKQPTFTHDELLAMWHVMPAESASAAQKSALEKLDRYAAEARGAGAQRNAEMAKTEIDVGDHIMCMAGEDSDHGYVRAIRGDMAEVGWLVSEQASECAIESLEPFDRARFEAAH